MSDKWLQLNQQPSEGSKPHTGDGIVLARVTASDRPKYHDESIASGSTYTYAVVALDAAGNRSPESNAVPITTP